MKSDGNLQVGQAPAWYKRKTVLFFSVLLTLLVISVLSGYFYQQNALKNNPAKSVSFTCRPSLGNENFTITVEVNLEDGMDEDEAIRVAAEVYERNTPEGTRLSTSLNSSAHMLEDGIWAVQLHLVHFRYRSYCATRQGFTRGEIHEYFEATINPFAYTVVYGHA